MKDEIVILGSGGGRHHIRTQYRATGGILLKVSGIQTHIDPGPGAIVRINQYQEDPTKTELFIVTHFHLDHYNDLAVMIEASRKILHDKNHHYFKKGTLITTPEVVNYVSKYHLDMLENTQIFDPDKIFSYKNIKIIGTKVKHTETAGFGVKIKSKDYNIAYSSDTTVFEGFGEQFNGVDALILNLLRPNSVVCRRHLSTDQVIPELNKITPKPNILILNHFGAYMDSPLSKMNYVPSQVEKIRKNTNIKNVIAAEDGLKLSLSDLLS
ncbi:MAG: MBL fold metallo-hydrolase [Promethearchaeati archaeon]